MFVKHKWPLVAMCLLAAALAQEAVAESQPLQIAGPPSVEPASLSLSHRRQPHSLLVTGRTADGLSVDLTDEASFSIADETVAAVTESGWVFPLRSGKSIVTITVAGKKIAVDVKVDLPEKERPYSFVHEVMPVLSKGGCNAGSCHGFSLGKNGFMLSLRGADAGKDFLRLTQEFLSRRINRHQPDASLLLTKPLGDAPHKGGVRFQRGSLSHDILRGWIEDGAPGDLDSPAELLSIESFPSQIVLRPGDEHRLQLVAHYSDGSSRDVTPLAVFTVNNETVLSVDDAGAVSAGALGETAVVARYERKFAVTGAIVLIPKADFQPSPIAGNHPIDDHVARKLNSVRIAPSAMADDSMFLRRLYLDLIGVQPKPDEIRAFLADPSSDKREKVVDALFVRSEFVDHWSLKWGDLLQNSRTRLSEPAVYAFRQWIRSAVASNMPLDEFARSILTSSGGMDDHPASAYYVVSKDVNDTLERATQVFCGVHMLCARCHPHPHENWTQADYFGLASFFNQVTTKPDPLQPKVANAKRVVLNLKAGYARNPRTGRPQPPRYLGGEEPKIAAETDRRAVYARWLVSAENPYFARSMANRIWSYFFHRGIIDPVDDLRITNPPVNPELLDYLTRDMIESGFDMRRVMRRIVMSQTYGRSSVPLPSNRHDDINFSHAVPRRIPAEALLDSLVQATGVPERFAGVPAGFTAAQLPDGNVKSEFLSLFGKPQRAEACECERDDSSNMLQALHLINGKSITARVASPQGRVAALVKQDLSDKQLIEELYLWSLARFPSDDEIRVSLAHFQAFKEQRGEAAQDVMWALLNSKDFVLVR